MDELAFRVLKDVRPMNFRQRLRTGFFAQLQEKQFQVDSIRQSGFRFSLSPNLILLEIFSCLIELEIGTEAGRVSIEKKFWEIFTSYFSGRRTVCRLECICVLEVSSIPAKFLTWIECNNFRSFFHNICIFKEYVNWIPFSKFSCLSNLHVKEMLLLFTCKLILKLWNIAK